MEPFTIYAKSHSFSLAFSVYQGMSFDNIQALGLRLSLVFAEEGSGIALINERPIPYMAPCVFCMNETEHIVIPETNNSKIKAIFFHPSILNGFLNFENIREHLNDVYFTVAQDRDMIRFFLNRDNGFMSKFTLGPLSAKKFTSLIDTLDKQTREQTVNWPCRSRSYIMEILFLLENISSTESLKNETHVESIEEDFYPILQYIYNNYDKKISVDELTEHFHISRSTFAKRFKDNMGEPFLEHLNKMRITMAATMLRDTQLPVSEIMFRVGFSDNVHFLRTFKKYINEPPSLYREKYNWM